MLKKISSFLCALALCLAAASCREKNLSEEQDKTPGKWVYFGYFMTQEPAKNLIEKINRGTFADVLDTHLADVYAGRFDRLNGREFYTQNICSHHWWTAELDAVRADRVRGGELMNGEPEDKIRFVRNNKFGSLLANYEGYLYMIISRGMYDNLAKGCNSAFPLRSLNAAHRDNQKYAYAYYADTYRIKGNLADFARDFFRREKAGHLETVYSYGRENVKYRILQRNSSCSFRTGEIRETVDIRWGDDETRDSERAHDAGGYVARGNYMTLTLSRAAFEKLWAKCEAKAER